MISYENIYYINLEKGIDRKNQIESELEKMGLVGTRFPGIVYEPKETDKFNNLNIYSPNAIGCQMSHLELIKMAKNKNLENIIIFEDDFEFMVDRKTFYEQINRFNDLIIEFDVLFLSYNVKESEPYNELISYGRSVQTTSGYIVNSNFFDKIISNLEEGLELHIKTQLSWKYSIDQYWKSLQETNRWFYFNKRIGRQRLSFSDIMGEYVCYGL
jgi:GR25 family glycosyltransferase involved in LPS biosynthesis